MATARRLGACDGQFRHHAERITDQENLRWTFQPALLLSANSSAKTARLSPDPTLFNEAAVFAAERERIFARPWMAADHVTRLADAGRYFRFDADSRSIVVTRDSDGRLHALRNVCIHAGYPVCDAEEGSAERLMCPYHGWEYALDGRLVEPNLSSRIDPSRLRMTSYRICVRDGLLFVAPSASPPSDESIAGPLPAWLADGKVTKRECHNTTWNWKFMLNFVGSRPHLFFAGPADADAHDQLLRVRTAQPNNSEFRACGARSRHTEIRRAYRSPSDRDHVGRCPSRSGLGRRR